MIKFKI
jgi:hypothetical protein